MNSLLTINSKQDKRAKKDIMPLSEQDANIISEIIVALGFLNQDLLLTILNQYKSLPDNQILQLLRQYNADFDPINFEGEGALTPKFVEIRGGIYSIIDLKSIERDQEWSYSTNSMVYRVILNKNVTDNLFLSNKILKFNSLQQREHELAKLKKLFEMYKIKIV